MPVAKKEHHPRAGVGTHVHPSPDAEHVARGRDDADGSEEFVRDDDGFWVPFGLSELG